MREPRVLLVSGIFVASPEFRSVNLQESTETLLADGLRSRGVEVDTVGHDIFAPWDRYDIVHVHHLANACLKLFLPQRAAVVFTRHATKALPLHHRLVLAHTYRRSAAIVALSNKERSLVSSRATENKVSVIPNGLNGSNFPLTNRYAPSSTEPWRILYVGQLIELKRVGIALQLVRDLTDRGFLVALDIVYHRNTLLQDLEKLARVLRIDDRVNFLGPKTRESIGTAMTASHILVLPSRTEALPTVVTEAVFSGLPVLAYDVGGVKEQLPSGVPLPAVDNYDGFLNAAVHVLNNYSSVVKDYEHHSAYARETFTIEAMVDRHLDLYREVADA